MTDTDKNAKRWTVKGWDDDHIEFEDDGGKWVAWNDYCALAAERNEWKARAERAEGALSGVAANSTDKKARFIATEALAQIDAQEKLEGETE